MSSRVLLELNVLLGSFATGLAAGVCYDISRLLRLPFKKSALRDAVFDIMFYAASGALCALSLFALNGGSPKLYALSAMGAGAFVYISTFSKSITRLCRKISDRRKKSR